MTFSERPQLMLLENMNWLGMLCEKLAGVIDGEIVKKSIFLEATHAGVWEDCVGCLRQTSILAMLPGEAASSPENVVPGECTDDDITPISFYPLLPSLD